MEEGLMVVFGAGDIPYLHCKYGHGSFRCGSYVSITHNGAYHFCTQPAAHGFNLTLEEVLEIAKEQGHQIEKQVRNYTDQCCTTDSRGDAAQKAS